MMSLYGPLTRLYWRRLPGLVRGREQSAIVRAMKPRAGVRFTGPDKLVHLIGNGEVVPRLGRVVAERLRRAQIADGITDRNQLAAFTLHGLFSHAGQTAPGGTEWMRVFGLTGSRGKELRRKRSPEEALN